MYFDKSLTRCIDNVNILKVLFTSRDGIVVLDSEPLLLKITRHASQIFFLTDQHGFILH